MATKGRSRSRRSSPVSTAHNEFAETMKGIQDKFGAASFFTADEDHQPDRISTGVFMVDFATLGGIPHNRISMFVGQRHAGKSTLADKVTACCQQQYPDQVCAKIDVEGTHDTVWSTKLGIDASRLYISKPETGEQAVDIADALVRTKEVSLIVVDSLAALTPMKEIDSSAEDAHVGLQARLVGGMIRKLTAGLIAERNRGHFVTVLFINQYRSKIGAFQSFGEPLSLPGGKAVEFSTSLQLVVKNKETMGKDEHDVESVTVNEHSFEVKKNKLNGGPRSGEFRLCRVPNQEYGLSEGEVDDASTLLAYAKKFGAYSGGGSSWTLDFWDEEHRVRGANEAILRLYEDRNLYWKLRNFLICEQARHLGMPDQFLERFYP